MSGIVLRGATIYDGTGAPAYQADVLIENGVIEAVGDGLGASQTIDIGGLALCPGFIDAHAHSDFSLMGDPHAAEGKLVQGITSEVNGNCGMSAAPLIGAASVQREADLISYEIAERWQGLPKYMELLEARGLGMNLATLIGHGNLRASVVGYEDRAASEEDMRAMCGLLQDGLRAGAIGLSTGLIYPPGVYSCTAELSALCHAGAKVYERFIYTTHMRSEGRLLLESIAEAIEIGRCARVHISHIKTADKSNWHKADAAIAMLDAARADGVMITCDRYPYTASSTDLDAALPDWTFVGGNAEELRRIRDSATRARIAQELDGSGRDWDTAVVATVDSEANRWMEGQSVAAIARTWDTSPVEALLRILDEEALRVGAIFHSMCEENLLKFLALPYAMLGTDSTSRALGGAGKPHPRGFGSFPRYLRRYAKADLSGAISKCTQLPALTFNLVGRGCIAPGHRADIVVFDPETIMDTATFDAPYQAPQGIKRVYVNGRLAVDEGGYTGALGGVVLRHGG